MKYLMFIYGENNLFNAEQITNKIGEEIQPVVNSEQIKFIYGDGSAVFHFGANLNFEEMSIYCDLIFEELDGIMYILIPFEGKVSSNAGKERIDHLLKINTKIDDQKNRLHEYNDEMFDMFINLINTPNPTEIFMEYKVEEVCNMTLDELLDKINDTGLGSLTDIEMKKLEEYSK